MPNILASIDKNALSLYADYIKIPFTTHNFEIMDEKTLKSFYEKNISDKTSEINVRKHRGRSFVVAELVTFSLAVAFFVYFVSNIHTSAYSAYIALAWLILYIVFMRLDSKNSKHIDKLEAVRDVYIKEKKYLERDFTSFDDGERYANPEHPFTFDMDVFGRESLFNRISRAVTTGGSDRLAQLLGSLPKNSEEVQKKCEAQKEIAEDETWRTSFIALGERVGQIKKTDRPLVESNRVEQALLGVNQMKISSFAMSPLSLGIVMLAFAGFITTILMSVFSDLPSVVPTTWGVLQFFVILLCTGKTLGKVSKAVNILHKQLGVYIKIVEHINNKEFHTDNNKKISEALFGEDSNCLESFSALSQILDGLDRRGNVLGLLFFNILYASDYFLLRKFLKWKQTNLPLIGKWIEAVNEMDATVSMAVYRYNNPLLHDAEVTDEDSVVYDAKEIYHPFIGASAVKNDFTIADNNYYIVTGANMAGKSTFLRTLGINYILAMNGMPVSASNMHVSVFNLFSSMRTTDDLSHGISYFNAELLRLKQLIANCKQARHTLIILDEILKGTNSLDKLNGSRLFLQEISRLPVSGIIATHDLELSKLENERFHNYCFEINLSNKITYSYKITPGVAKNQNATYLLRNIIKDI